MARHHEVWGQCETPTVEAVQPQVGVADSMAAVEHGLTVAGGLPVGALRVALVFLSARRGYSLRTCPW
jgi:hypothetical protein